MTMVPSPNVNGIHEKDHLLDVLCMPGTFINTSYLEPVQSKKSLLPFHIRGKATYKVQQPT